MPYEIRPATPTDAPAVVRLIKELAAESGGQSPLKEDDVVRYLENPAAHILLACSGSLVVGLASYLFHHNLYHAGKVCLVEELIVNWGHRNRGVGSALLQKVLSEAREAGCAEISLSTETKNQAALRFYRRLGFDYEAVYLEKHFE